MSAAVSGSFFLEAGFAIGFRGGDVTTGFSGVGVPVFTLLVLADLAEDFTTLLVVTVSYPGCRA
jgi:hypothetical protein